MKRINFEKLGPWIALIVLVIVSALTSEHFLKPQNLLNILRQVSYTGIIALGMTFIIIAGGIDLSVGSAVALVGCVTMLALNQYGLVAAVFAALVAGCLAGVLNGTIITVGRVAPFIVTLGTMALFRSLALYVSKAGEFRSENAAFESFGAGVLLGVPVPVWLFFGLAGVFAVVLNLTPFGRHVRAVGSNERVAQYAAINVRLMRLVTYLIGGFTVGVSALLLAARFNSVNSSSAGLNFELDAIAAAIIGGTSLAGGRGTIAGVIAGAVTLGIVNNMLNLWSVSPYLQGTVKGLVIIAAALVQRRRA
jgi:ribose transport system permease protein